MAISGLCGFHSKCVRPTQLSTALTLKALKPCKIFVGINDALYKTLLLSRQSNVGKDLWAMTGGSTIRHQLPVFRGNVDVRHLLAATVGAIAILIALILAISAYWERKQRLFANTKDLFAAVRAFCTDQAGRGQVPPEVSLQDLFRGGYVTSNEIRAFEGFEVTFSTHYSDDEPQLILARALAPDGHSTCLLPDGSVQQLSAQKYSEYLKSSGRPTGATNQNEGPWPETN